MIDLALILLSVSFLAALVRVAIGPSLADRAVAADVAFFSAVAAVALLAIRFEAYAFDDAVLMATLLGFVATASLAWLLGRGR
ncbi:MAG TPA: monovalent cation/H+ antiporter complex subunit F [Actinomycetota bacterium]|jgi:multicomponent Na+:H+ antiporter subunit F|nr:monovalent cation/H+ antiporter complex subunit F [Actinomycetota bacterium]